MERGFTSRANTSIHNFFGVNPSDRAYSRVSHLTQTGLEFASMAVAGKGLVQGTAKLAKRAVNFKSGVKLNAFHEAARNLPKTAQNNIRILRGWAKSKGWRKLPNPEGRPEMWGVHGKEKFTWLLKIKAKPSFRPGIEKGSLIPRFDSRLAPEDGFYINPFTGKMGGKDVGKHIPLQQAFYE